LYGRAARLTSQHGGFRRGQSRRKVDAALKHHIEEDIRERFFDEALFGGGGGRSPEADESLALFGGDGLDGLSLGSSDDGGHGDILTPKTRIDADLGGLFSDDSDDDTPAPGSLFN
jgi:hypothetical protein